MKKALLSFGILFMAACSAGDAPPEPAESLKDPPVQAAPRVPAAAPASAAVWLAPEDGMTNVPPGAVRIGVRGLPVPQGLAALRALSGSVRLVRVDDGATGPVTVSVPREDAYGEGDEVDVAATVMPASELREGWYELWVPPAGVQVSAALHASVRTRDGSVITRFRVGSEPQVRQVRWNAASGTLELVHSEPVTPGPSSMAVELDGAPRSCQRIAPSDAKVAPGALTAADVYTCGSGGDVKSVTLLADDAPMRERLGSPRLALTLDRADRIGSIHILHLSR
ncbi:Hypothetical protein A7982_01165 [Minicystis rosea]|nr:Hypothetical protein A7982_01165 [Minicystis rosea]